jgi:type 1 glutamine amidotransferase
MKEKIIIGFFTLLFTFGTFAQVNQMQSFEVNIDWLKKIENLAPNAPEVNPTKKHNVLVFDLITGFQHWNTPHINEVMKILGNKSGVYSAEITNDIFVFEKKNLKKYDAIVLNNNCPISPRRNIFLDQLDKNDSYSLAEKDKIAKRLESNILKFVKNGGGLMAIHGGSTMQIASIEFSEMLGGSFDYHPPQQKISVMLVDKDHTLLKAFEGKPFVHIDEPYIFKNAYAKKNFRPLLYIDTSELIFNKKIDEKIKYISWIKSYGKGRVFYSSLSHNAQSFENTNLLKFFLDGMQYVLGDLECEDSPGGFVN